MLIASTRWTADDMAVGEWVNVRWRLTSKNCSIVRTGVRTSGSQEKNSALSDGDLSAMMDGLIWRDAIGDRPGQFNVRTD